MLIPLSLPPIFLQNTRPLFNHIKLQNCQQFKILGPWIVVIYQIEMESRFSIFNLVQYWDSYKEDSYKEKNLSSEKLKPENADLKKVFNRQLTVRPRQLTVRPRQLAVRPRLTSSLKRKLGAVSQLCSI